MLDTKKIILNFGRFLAIFFFNSTYTRVDLYASINGNPINLQFSKNVMLKLKANLNCIRIEILRIEKKVECIWADCSLWRHRCCQIIFIVIIRVDHVVWETETKDDDDTNLLQFCFFDNNCVHFKLNTLLFT
jgi:hypothetical protein